MDLRKYICRNEGSLKFICTHIQRCQEMLIERAELQRKLEAMELLGKTSSINYKVFCFNMQLYALRTTVIGLLYA